MPKANKKQRHKAKREAKRLQARRRESISPLKRLAEAPGVAECWMSDGFDVNGQAQMFVYKRAAGLTGIACFLVDRGVVGLKDAWTQMKVERSEFQRLLDRSRSGGIAMKRVTVNDIRRMVAGGIRWAHDNGMRLPKDWAKTAALIGGVGDWASADVSQFVNEFAGHPEDLRQRLISEPFESYIRRPDIEFTFSDNAPYLDQETGEYIDADEWDDEEDYNEDEFEADEFDDEELQSLIDDLPKEQIDALIDRYTTAAVGLAQETTHWLEARNQAASPELMEAWRSMILATTIAKAALPDDPEGDDAADLAYETLEELTARIELSRAVPYQQAVEQMLDFLENDPAAMRNAILKYGLKQLDPPEET